MYTNLINIHIIIDAITTLIKVITIWLNPILPIFLLRDINKRIVVIIADIELANESPPIPIIFTSTIDKIIFITRRNDIVPPVVKLNPNQALEAFMLGESIETSAGDPTKAGQSKRCVGTNPFIMGPEIEEGLRLKEILQNNPDMECYILNTGSVGAKDDFKGEKLSIKVSTTIMKEIAKDTINWIEDEEWGYKVPTKVNGIDIEKYNETDVLKDLRDKAKLDMYQSVLKSAAEYDKYEIGDNYPKEW